MIPLLQSPPLYVEITSGTFHACQAGKELTQPLERRENGLLTPACKERLARELRAFLPPRSWQPQARVFCALGARGVSLRRFTLPAARGEEWERLMLLRIEAEFPLPPEELAWGCVGAPAGEPSGQGPGDGREWVVAAAKKEVVEDYEQLFADCGLAPQFTLAALARGGACTGPGGAYTVLDVSAWATELICFERDTPVGLRVLPWGREHLLGHLQRELRIDRQGAERLLTQPPTPAGGPEAPTVERALQAAVSALGEALRETGLPGNRVYVAGLASPAALGALRRLLGDRIVCEPPAADPHGSLAVQGLRRFCEQNGGAPPLVLEIRKRPAEARRPQATPWRWALLCVALGLASWALRYAESALRGPSLTRRIAETRAYQAKLPNLDRELSFLQYLNTNQPPYLEAVAAVAQAAPSGLRVESLSLSRKGEFALKAVVRDMAQAIDFRAKMVDSGFFTNVVFEEQAPTPDRQKMNLRILAQWRPVNAREALTRELARAGSGAAPTNTPPAKAKE